MLSVLPHNIAPHTEGIFYSNLQKPFFPLNVYYSIIYIHIYFLPFLPPFNNNNNNEIFRCITNKVSSPIVIAWNGTVQNGMSCMVTHIPENDKNGMIIHATDNNHSSHENVHHQPLSSVSSSSSEDIPCENSIQAIKNHKNYDVKNYRKNALVENLVGKRLI